ncbi:MAG TPA: Clp protease ClpP [Erysipelotrichaceae bacterium]|nr:Clp protease ClpP [Erysipelotrichaceae bacterium]
MKKFYEFKPSSESDDTTELIIHGDITSMKWEESDVGSFDIAKELKEVKTSNLLVRINSYGGEVSQGLGIYNLLRSFQGKVTTINDGFACSAASVIYMAGVKRVMPRSALLMIHNAATIAWGDSNDFIKMADTLAKVTQPSVEVYKSVSNLSEAEIKKMMDDETWISADEALKYGFATHIVEQEPTQSLENHYLRKVVMELKTLKNQQTAATPPMHEDLDEVWGNYFGTKGE